MSKDQKSEEQFLELGKIIVRNSLPGENSLLLQEAFSLENISDRIAQNISSARISEIGGGSVKEPELPAEITYESLKETIHTCNYYEKIVLIQKMFRLPMDVLQPILNKNFDKLFNEVFKENKILFLEKVLELPDDVLNATFVTSHTKFSANLDAVASGTCGAAYGGPLFQKFSCLLSKLDECSGGVVSAILANPTPAEFDSRALMSGPLTLNKEAGDEFVKLMDPADDTHLGGDSPDHVN